MLDLLKTELEREGAFNGKLPNVLTQVTKAISAPYLPERMKYTIAISEIMVYAGHFRRNIELWNKALIPINTVSFSLAKSGAGKDRSVAEARKCFSTGYKKLEDRRKDVAKRLAIQKAANDGVENPHEFEVYKEYYTAPPPLFTAITNSAAFLSHVAELEASGVGAGYIYSGEFGTELKTNQDMITTIKDVSEMYDDGGKEAKPLKDKGNQTAAIECMPINALFMSSPDNILYNRANKERFVEEFSTKLARRSIFNYSPEDMKRPEMDRSDPLAVKKMLADKIKDEDTALAVRESTDATVSVLTDYQVQYLGKAIEVEDDVRYLFELYLEYNKEKADHISKLFPISKLVRTHLQWKSLKIAGAIAFFNRHEVITKEDYIEAINFVELLDKDMEAFETELVKEPYELFVSYMHSIADNNEAVISLHQLRKLGYIPTTGKADVRLKELVNLASSYDKTGLYTAHAEGINFKRIVKTNASGVSYLAVSGSKAERTANCADGYNFAEIEFRALGEMLEKDWAYAPFKFKDGKRGKDFIEGGCKWICLDVDKSSITDKEAHQLLGRFNHHIVRTSDPDNEFKFRVLLELDSLIDVPDKVWKPFIKSISDFLSIECDLLPKAQIYFSYSGREIYSVTNAEPIEVKDHLLFAHNYNAAKPDIDKYTAAQKKALLADKLSTFDYAFDAEPGNRSLSLIRAAKHAYKTLELSRADTIELMREINDYWVIPMAEDRLQSTIISQIERW